MTNHDTIHVTHTVDESEADQGVDGAFRSVKSAGRVLEVLEELASSGPRPMRALADLLGVPRSSMHALLRTMQHYGWVETDATGTLYGLGVRSLLAGSAYVDRDDIVVRTAPVLDTLAEKTGETVHLGRLEGNHVVYLAKRESIHPLRMFSSVGRRLSAFTTALGKCMLALLPDAELEAAVPQQLVPITPKTITDRDELLGDIRRVRSRGYAIDNEETALGLRCFAIALPQRGTTQDSISLSVPISRLDQEREEELIRFLFEARYTFAT